MPRPAEALKMENEADQSLTAILEKTPISALQELCTKYKLIPRYDNVQIEGLVHSPTFTFRVTVGELVSVFLFSKLPSSLFPMPD